MKTGVAAAEKQRLADEIDRAERTLKRAIQRHDRVSEITLTRRLGRLEKIFYDLYMA